MKNHWCASCSIFLSFTTLSQMILIHSKDWELNVTVDWWLLQLDVIYPADAAILSLFSFFVSGWARLALQLFHMSLPWNLRKCQRLPTTAPFKLFTVLQVVYKDLLTCCKYWATSVDKYSGSEVNASLRMCPDMHACVTTFNLT